MSNPFLKEEDRSLPVKLPTDRPLTYEEQRLIWADVVPEPLRRGPQPDPCDFNSKADCERAWEQLSNLARVPLTRYGWLLNRLDWDNGYMAGVEPKRREVALLEYGVPDCCQPGHQRVRRSVLQRMRAAWGKGHWPTRRKWTEIGKVDE